MVLKEQIKRIPVIGNLARKIYGKLKRNRPVPPPESFPGSEKYWEDRYSSGGNSGVGSYDKFAEFKAEVLNAFVSKYDVQSVIEFGCGDGNQLQLAAYPAYMGFDVSSTAIDICRSKFSDDPTKTFELVENYERQTAELGLSLDVIYHLIEDDIFENYMRNLFRSASRYVIIYASNTEDNAGYEGTHVWHRNFTRWTQENVSTFRLIMHIPNKYPYEGDYRVGSFSDFYMYERLR